MADMTASPKKSPHEVFSKSLVQIAIVRSIISDIERAEGHHPNRKKSYVLRSYVVYLLAVWQQFIREIGKECIQLSYKHSGMTDQLAARLEGFEREFGRRNFTSAEQVSEAIEYASGIPQVMRHCHWDGYSSDKVAHEMARLGNARNQIAHEAYTDQPLDLQINFTWMAVLFGASATINNIINNEFERRYCSQPFPPADPIAAFEQLQHMQELSDSGCQ
jgi:hypothetical protein